MDITITNDPTRIAELWAELEEWRPADPVQRLLWKLSESKFRFERGELTMLKEHRAEAVPRLLELARRVGLRDYDGANAIVALCLLEEPAVLSIARQILRAEGEAAAYRDALLREEGRFLGTDPEIRKMFLEELDSDDPRRVREVMQACGILAMPGVVERFVALLPKVDSTDRQRLAFWIGRIDPSPANLRAISKAWLDEPPGSKWVGNYFDAIARAAYEGPPEAHRAAIEILLHRLHDDFEGTSRLVCKSFPALDAFRRAASDDPRCIEMAVAMLAIRHDLDQLLVRFVLDIIAAGDPGRHRAMCLDWLQGAGASDAAAVAASLASARAGTGDREAVAAIQGALGRHGAGPYGGTYADAFARIGGPAGDAAAEAACHNIPGTIRQGVLWRTRKIDARWALHRLAAVGALEDPDGLLEAARESLRDDPYVSVLEPGYGFGRALEMAGVLILRDSEAHEIPPSHEELILELSEATRGRFVVKGASQAWDLPPGITREDVIDGEFLGVPVYRVEFVHDGRLFTISAEYRNEWYDVDSIATAFNEALRITGRAERFHPLDGAASFLFLTPEAAAVARDELFWTIYKPLQAESRG